MSKYRIVDADCHILEPPDIWTNWLPKTYQDKAPKLVKDAQGGDAWQTAVGGEPDPIGLVATPASRSTSSAGSASPTRRPGPVVTTASSG